MTYGPRLRHGEYVGGKESPEHYIWRGLFRRGKDYRWNGMTKTLTEWANYLGLSKQLARYRIREWGTFIKGETFDDA